jgi:hypothetical protein
MINGQKPRNRACGNCIESPRNVSRQVFRVRVVSSFFFSQVESTPAQGWLSSLSRYTVRWRGRVVFSPCPLWQVHRLVPSRVHACLGLVVELVETHSPLVGRVVFSVRPTSTGSAFSSKQSLRSASHCLHLTGLPRYASGGMFHGRLGTGYKIC